MSLAPELAALLRRDLKKLAVQVRAFPDDDLLWRAAPPAITNSAGNLALHLEGNLREYIGRQLGGIPYVRVREREFSDRGLPAADLAARIDALAEQIPAVVAALTDAQLEAEFPQNVIGSLLPVRQFVVHLHGHLNYHLGQIDILRRHWTGTGAVAYPAL